MKRPGRPVDVKRHPFTLLRVSRGLSMHDVQAQSGIHPNTLCNIERGHVSPKPGTRRKLMKMLGIDYQNHWEIFGPMANYRPDLEPKECENYN